MTQLSALQTALAGEHAVIFGYGVAGAHLRGAAQRRARAADAAHRTRRDELRALVVAAKATPVGSAAAYQLPYPVTSAATAARLATDLEARLGAVYADAVAALRGDLRSFAAVALQDAAVLAAGWRGHSVAFPGLNPAETA